MCGIGGRVDFAGQPVAPAALARSLARLAPRGPDGEGVHTAASGQATLWHRRLAIVDLSPAGAQPMVTPDGRYTLVGNGEIYNHARLRAALQAAGHRFVGHSDNEVLLHGFAAWGPKLAERLDGIFAFAVWDDEERALFLARDRMGVKPLFYAPTPGGVSFASTVDALVDVAPRPDRDAFAHYWAFGFFAHGRSALRGVHKVDPGHWMTVSRGATDTRRYARPVPQPAEDRSRDEWVDAIDDELQRSVRDQLMSDVPCGVFLSGGIDSGLLCTLAAQASDKPLHAFSLGFAAWDDELPLARATARHAGVTHVAAQVHPDEVLQSLPDIVDAYDEPLADTSVIPTYFVSRLARAHGVPVVLSGDAGDELFAGYRRYPELLRRYRRTWPLSGHFPRLDRQVMGYRLSKIIRAGALDWLRETLPPDRLGPLLGPSMARSMPRGVHPGLAFQLGDLEQYLPLDLLTKVDRASMAHAIEARVPFLSNGLVDLAMRIPPTLQHDQPETKPLLRAVAARHLPAEVCRAPKEGFALPFEGPFRGLRESLAQKLAPDGALVAHGLLEHAHYQSGLVHPRAAQNWAVILAELWARRHLDGQSLDEMRALLTG